MDTKTQRYQDQSAKTNQRPPYFCILARTLLWFIFGPQRRKFAKVWATYRYGGITLCWQRAAERFGGKKCLYDSSRNQLSLSQSKHILAKCPHKPLVSIVVPVYKVNIKWLEQCISSVVRQCYTNWELILVDDVSEKDDLKQLMNAYAVRDKRIRTYYLEENRGIAGATNFGIKQARGDFIGFLDHDDELTIDALTWVIWYLNKYPDALWFYSDEDLITTKGKCHSPHFKPDFSPELLLSMMYTTHFRVYSAHIINEVRGIRWGFEGSQDHDLALRLSEIVPRENVIHIPRVLYHWREIPTSAAMSIEEKPNAPISGRKAVKQAMKRRNLIGYVTSNKLYPTLYQIKLQPRGFPKVSIIIPIRNSFSLLQKCICLIRQHTSYPNYEILIIDNQSDDLRVKEYLAAESSRNHLKVMQYNNLFNHSELNNIAVSSVNTEFVVFMNNDIQIVSHSWLEQLVAVAHIDDSIAAVGGLLLYPDGRVQHGGIILGLNGVVGHAHKHIDGKSTGYFGRLYCLQEMSGVTAAFSLVKKSAFEIVGGFNSERYPTSFNDVDFCIRLRKNGFRCLYNPMVRAIHHESKTRPITPEELDYQKRLIDDYSEILGNDPFYNPNLALDNEQFRGFRPFPIEDQIPELANIVEMASD